MRFYDIRGVAVVTRCAEEMPPKMACYHCTSQPYGGTIQGNKPNVFKGKERGKTPWGIRR